MNGFSTMDVPEIKSIGYIYVRCNEWWLNDYKSCKMGKTTNIPDRDSQYATGEIKRGYFESVYEVNCPIIVERVLKYEFRELNIIYDGGTEFYNQKIIDLIEPKLTELGIEYRKLSKQEISDLVRRNRVKKICDSIKPRHDQDIIISKSVQHFRHNDKGILVLPCGTGKTHISLWIINQISNRILIGVPSIIIRNQWEKVIRNVLPKFPFLIVSGGVTVSDITKFLKENKKKCIVLTTYSSVHKVYDATQTHNFIFDMKILDEVHHLTSVEFEEKHRKRYVKILDIRSEKQLSLTATLKILENNTTQRDDDIIISNDNVDFFGELIVRKSLMWGINGKFICDYKIVTMITNEEQIETILSNLRIENKNTGLFFSAFVTLKSIFSGNSHHSLIYSNNRDNSSKIIEYIKILLDMKYFDIPDLHYSNYHGVMKPDDKVKIINDFQNSKFGIISCVYCLSEGWDFPELDSSVFAETMTSPIRIFQSGLRPCRKNEKEPNKIAKIILPIVNRDLFDENPDFKKVREVIYQMGLEDETITQKINVFRIDIEKQKPKSNEKEDKEMVEIGEYDDELTQKLRLKIIKRSAFTTTYEKARKIIADKNVKNKESYYELCKIDNRLPDDPEIVFKGQFTNWFEYLSIELQEYYDLETCKDKVREYLSSHPEQNDHYLDLSKVCDALCEIDKLFPPNGLWVECYKVKDLRDIITITNRKKETGIILE